MLELFGPPAVLVTLLLQGCAAGTGRQTTHHRQTRACTGLGPDLTCSWGRCLQGLLCRGPTALRKQQRAAGSSRPNGAAFPVLSRTLLMLTFAGKLPGYRTSLPHIHPQAPPGKAPPHRQTVGSRVNPSILGEVWLGPSQCHPPRACLCTPKHLWAQPRPVYLPGRGRTAPENGPSDTCGWPAPSSPGPACQSFVQCC